MFGRGRELPLNGARIVTNFLRRDAVLFCRAQQFVQHKAGHPPGFFLSALGPNSKWREGMMTRQQIERLAKRKSCPRCSMEKTEGTALCRRCRYKLPANMRIPLEGIVRRKESVVTGAIRAAANYFDIHYQSIRNFRGGRNRQ